MDLVIKFQTPVVLMLRPEEQILIDSCTFDTFPGTDNVLSIAFRRKASAKYRMSVDNHDLAGLLNCIQSGSRSSDVVVFQWGQPVRTIKVNLKDDDNVVFEIEDMPRKLISKLIQVNPTNLFLSKENIELIIQALAKAILQITV